MVDLLGLEPTICGLAHTHTHTHAHTLSHTHTLTRADHDLVVLP